MIVYPVKWLPYMFIIGGIGMIILDEGDFAWNLFVVGVGIAWLVIKKKFFNKPMQSNTSSVNYTQTFMNQMNYGAEPKQASKFCTSCGAKVQPNDKFCMNCGNKLN